MIAELASCMAIHFKNRDAHYYFQHLFGITKFIVKTWCGGIPGTIALRNSGRYKPFLLIFISSFAGMGAMLYWCHQRGCW